MATGVAFCMAITLWQERIWEKVFETNWHHLNHKFDAIKQSLAASTA
jgi:hypothetical protein